MTRSSNIKANLFALSWLPLAILVGLGTAACEHHHHDDDHHVVVVDEHGYRHEGYYDENRHWHGGWYDEHNVRHEDPDDWRR